MKKNTEKNNFYRPNNFNFGITFRYILKKFSFGIEYWKGINNTKLLSGT